MDTSLAQTKIEAGIGAALLTTPVWSIFLQDISLVASTIAAICGAIIGVNAVLRLMRRSRRPPGD